MEDLHLIARIYDSYTHSKERFIDRNFQTNRFFLALSLILLAATYIVKALVPDLMCTIVISGFGFLISALWWINLDTYQFMIKIKYANVLERIEDEFPVRPCQEEYMQAQEIKSKNKLSVFPDLQKGFAILIVAFFVFLFCQSLTTRLTQPIFNSNPNVNVPTVEVVE